MPLIPLKDLKTALPPGARLMGIDQGAKTWGLALSDPDLSYATPFKTLKRTKFLPDVAALGALCRDYGVKGLVIGLPLNMDGSAGPRTDSVRHFADNLLKAKETLGFDPLIAFYDERLSTHAAEQVLIDDLNMRHDKRKDVIDALAAAHILQGALDALKLTGS